MKIRKNFEEAFFYYFFLQKPPNIILSYNLSSRNEKTLGCQMVSNPKKFTLICFRTKEKGFHFFALWDIGGQRELPLLHMCRIPGSQHTSVHRCMKRDTMLWIAKWKPNSKCERTQKTIVLLRI